MARSILREWREKRGFSIERASEGLHLPVDKIKEYESCGFIFVPCNELYKMVCLYRISEELFYKVIEDERELLLKNLNKDFE